jgi:protocatechuate 3,4-dioxygenase beta subunit
MTTFLLLVDFLAFAGVSAIFFSMACRRRYDCKRGGLASEEAVMTFHTTRRGVLGALAAAGFAFDDALAAPLAATPACHDGDEPTVRQTDGPYFKPSSPLRADLIEPNSTARPVEVSGQVLMRSCQPVARALLDFWHADERGDYDNVGFRYRGHLFTDAEGRYRLRTILPALYTGRTRHYHVKVQAPQRGVLTTQLYFPDEPMNRRDGLFRRELVMRMAEAGDGLAARFDFVLDMR